MDINNIPSLMKYYSPVNEKQMEKLEKKLGLIISNVYRNLLESSNGLLLNHACLYSIDEAIEMNQTYEVQKYAGEYIAIGNDGGGYHLLMKAHLDEVTFQLIGFGDGIPKESNVSDNVIDWLSSRESNSWRNQKYEEVLLF